MYRPALIVPDKKNTRDHGFTKPLKQYTLSDETFLFINEALFDVVHATDGTGYRARIPEAHVAGKTGTAQVVSLKKKPPKGQPVPRHLENHAWFIAFSPVSVPEIVVCVFLEHGGSGGRNAAPIAQKVLKAFYDYKKIPGL